MPTIMKMIAVDVLKPSVRNAGMNSKIKGRQSFAEKHAIYAGTGQTFDEITSKRAEIAALAADPAPTHLQ
jgi:hypothetical protein